MREPFLSHPVQVLSAFAQYFAHYGLSFVSVFAPLLGRDPEQQQLLLAGVQLLVFDALFSRNRSNFAVSLLTQHCDAKLSFSVISMPRYV